MQGFIDKLMGKNTPVSKEFARSLATALQQFADSITLPDEPLKGPMVTLAVFDQALEGCDTVQIRNNIATGLRQFANSITENDIEEKEE